MKLRLQAKKHEVGDVWSYYFKPLEPLTWVAGQSIRLELPRPTWGIDERRFTISSAPHEGHVRITTRLSESSFKQSLHALKADDEIQGFNIEGDFIWRPTRPMLFIAAGIGITPFRSIIAERMHTKQPLNITLLYASSDKPPIYYNELLTWQKSDPSFTMRILSKRFEIAPESTLAPMWKENFIYISGPEKMVRDITNSFQELGVARSRLKTDQFTGY